MKSYERFLCVLLLPCLSLGCASADADSEPETYEQVDEASLTILPEDQNLCCLPQIDTAAECNERDGFCELNPGGCTIFVDQECKLLTAQNREVGCCCK